MNVIDANKIEAETRKQADSEEWRKERKFRFTASKAKKSWQSFTKSKLF